MKMRIKKLDDRAYIPEYATEGSVGFDLQSIDDYVVIGDIITKVRTGLAVEVPNGYEMNVRARSGLSLKYPNYIVITGGGTVDFDYRGEIFVAVTNRTKKRWVIKKGDKIAQAIISPIKQVRFEVVDDLTDTVRGSGGYGHTGR